MTMKIFAVLLGVVIGVVLSDQSETTDVDAEPIGTPVDDAGKGRSVETPEVVLQLKYDRGELNRIYLAQFRKGKNSWSPSVSTRNNLCTDLCHAGLGGEVCGPTCEKLIPVGLKTALMNATESDATFGQPRVEVCPTLCHNMLGQPLCNCGQDMLQEDTGIHWSEICSAFCVTDNYVLSGCPACSAEAVMPTYTAVRNLNTAEGWVAWCNVQCRQGQGGAACNCDRAPL